MDKYPEVVKSEFTDTAGKKGGVKSCVSKCKTGVIILDFRIAWKRRAAFPTKQS